MCVEWKYFIHIHDGKGKQAWKADGYCIFDEVIRHNQLLVAARLQFLPKELPSHEYHQE